MLFLILSIAVVLNIRPAGCLFVAPELLFLHNVFWLGWHVYTETCLHANDTQTAGSLTAVCVFIFCGCRSTKMVCSKFTAKKKWTVKISNSKRNALKNLYSFSLQLAQDPCA